MSIRRHETLKSSCGRVYRVGRIVILALTFAVADPEPREGPDEQPETAASAAGASAREDRTFDVVRTTRNADLHALKEREAREHDRRARLHQLGAIARNPAAIDTLPDLTPEERRVVHRRHRTLNPLD